MLFRFQSIDISWWVDYTYTASTCDVMYCRQRRHLYYGGENLKYYLTPSPQFFIPRRAALTSNSNGAQSGHKGGFCYVVFNSYMFNATEVQLCKWCFHIYFQLFIRSIHGWRLERLPAFGSRTFLVLSQQ
jgi:hypothetical protein